MSAGGEARPGLNAAMGELCSEAVIDGELLRIDLTVDGSGVTIQSVRELKFGPRTE